MKLAARSRNSFKPLRRICMSCITPICKKLATNRNILRALTHSPTEFLPNQTKSVRSTRKILIKIQPDATVCRYLFTAKSLYMFRVSQHPSSGVLKTVTATSGTGHNTGTATSLQSVPIGPRWREVAVPLL